MKYVAKRISFVKKFVYRLPITVYRFVSFYDFPIGDTKKGRTELRNYTAEIW